MHHALATLLFFCCCLIGPLSAQYDFPLLTNGLAVRLDEQGAARLAATDFLAHPELQPTCGNGILLIGRSSSLTPRGDVPPSTVGDSITLSCNDFVFEPVEIWYQRLDGEWLVADTYVLLGGVAECACPDSLPACLLTTPLVYNGLSTSFGPGDSTIIAAAAYVARPESGAQYSFSADPADSLLVVRLGMENPQIVNIHAIRQDRTTRSVASYLILPDSTSADSTLGGGPAALVIHGLVVPVSSDLLATVPARAFAVPGAGDHFSGHLAFSTDPADTLRTFTAADIDVGGRPLEIFLHAADGTVGPPAVSYLTPDDPRRLRERTEVLPANDSLAGALLLNELPGCLLFQQNGRSTPAENEALPCPLSMPDWAPDTLSGSLWYRIVPRLDTMRTLRIIALDTLLATLYANEDIDCSTISQPISGSEYLLPGDTTVYAIECGLDVELPDHLLQVDRLGEGPARFLLQLDSQFDICVTNSEPAIPAPDFILFPNPARGRVSLQLSRPFIPGSHLNIYDMTGRIIAQERPTAGAMTHPVTLNRQPAGIYQVVLYQPGQPPASRRLVVH